MVIFWGSKSVLGIEFNLSGHNELNISERAFERVSNLQFLRLFGDHVHPDRLYLPQCLNYQLPKLRILEWFEFPMTWLPSNFSPKFLVELNMCDSELGKLWEEKQVNNFCKFLLGSYSIWNLLFNSFTILSWKIIKDLTTSFSRWFKSLMTWKCIMWLVYFLCVCTAAYKSQMDGFVLFR